MQLVYRPHVLMNTKTLLGGTNQTMDCLINLELNAHLRTMCGSRTGGWSLPCVMSD
jgi:hypothetical protein